jgi:hypothetical protein
VPTEINATDPPETLQTLLVVLENTIGSPLDADAVTVAGPWSTCASAGCANVIVCVCRTTGTVVTWKVRVTGSAAANVALPDWEAVTEHVPVAASVTDEPEIVHTLVSFDVNETASPLDDEAASETGPWSSRASAGCEKAIACDSGTAVTWNVRVTAEAAAYVPLPLCEAVSEHVPTATSVTLAPETVQTEELFEANATARLLDALAKIEIGPWSTRVSAGGGNVIVCANGAAVTWKVLVTGVAAAYAPLPLWDAVIEQVPTVSSVRVEPEAVHTEVLLDAMPTGKPLDAVAVNETGPWSTRVSSGCAKEIVCAATLTIVDEVAGTLSLV